MKFSKTKIVAVITALFFAHTVNANLVVNGGFEDNAVNTNSWKLFNSDDVAGWQGSNIEIWDNLFKFQSYEGSQHAELNSHSGNGQAYSIFQTFSTEIGSVYDFSFAYSARSNTNEAFQVDVISGKTNIYSQLVTDHVVKTWSVFDDDFTAVAAQTVLMFTSVTPAKSTLGNLLDDVKVIAEPKLARATTQVAEPYMPVLFAMGLVGLFVSRRINLAK
jgi:hypothetical protein